jgi:hypothetical protein
MELDESGSDQEPGSVKAAKRVGRGLSKINQDVQQGAWDVLRGARSGYDTASRDVQGYAADFMHWLTGDPTMKAVAQQDLGSGGGDPTQNLPKNEDDISGKKYKFTEVDPARGNPVQDYSAQDPTAKLTGALEQGPVQGKPADMMDRQLELLLGGVQNAKDISPNEYKKLTKLASGGNKLAQQILVKGHFKAQNYPSLGQDIKKVEDPFVNALSNMPQMAQALDTQVSAVTEPYNFSNAEQQVNNILKNQGEAQLAQPSAQTSAYANQLAAASNVDPLGTGPASAILSQFGFPGSINDALKGLGPAAKLAEKAGPDAALLGAILSHIQYQDIYGTGLSNAQNNPAWLQALLESVNATSGLGGALPRVIPSG